MAIEKKRLGMCRASRRGARSKGKKEGKMEKNTRTSKGEKKCEERRQPEKLRHNTEPVLADRQEGASKRNNSLGENELTSSPRATSGALSGLPSGDISCFPFKVEVKILPHPSFPPLAPPGTDDSERVLGPSPIY